MTYHPRRTAWHLKLARQAFAALLLALACLGAYGLWNYAGAHGDYEWVQKNPETSWCCSKRDCRSISERDVQDADPKFTYRPTGQTFERGKRGAYDSPNEQWHGCFYEGTPNLRCIFPPVRGY